MKVRKNASSFWYIKSGRIHVKKSLKPIFHWAFFGRVGVGNTIYYALATFQISFLCVEI